MGELTCTLATRLGRVALGVPLVMLLVVPHAMRFTRAADAHRLEAASARARRFRIAGRVTGLYPGARKTMRIKVTNPNRYKIGGRAVRAR